MEKEMATHSSILAWRIPGTGESGGLLSMGSHSQTRLKRLSSSSYSFKAPSNCLEPFLDPAKIPLYSCSILYLLWLLQFYCTVVVFVFLNMWVTSYQLFVQDPAPGRLKVKVLVTQSCLTFCDSNNCSLPGSSVYGILQARILEWVIIPFSEGSSWLRVRTHASALQLYSNKN